MSVQFGRWNWDGQPIDPVYFDKVRATLAAYGPDGFRFCSQAAVGILYGAFHTTEASRRESQPFVCYSGCILTWTGRLDNRSELASQLQGSSAGETTNLAIVAAAYEKWGTGCLARLIGDWALSIWDPNNHWLLVAKDPIGTYPLYYSFHSRQVTWSSLLDPLVSFANKRLVLENEYLAGWLSAFPAAHLTPYVGIHSVPPSCVVLLREGRETIVRYWDFDPGKRIRYRTDAEYEEEFRHLFATAVQRRLQSDRPVLAELSGGMDSSAIVCIADALISQGAGGTPQLDTVSYYDASEPNLDDHLYFTKVEERRGCVGRHIDFAGRRFFEQPKGGRCTPFAQPDRSGRPSEEFLECLTTPEHRVVLSGVGGDEVTGGVPTPVPELQDLIARGEWFALVQQLKVWALSKRKPWFHLLFEAARGFLPVGLAGLPAIRHPAPWLGRSFVRRNWTPLAGYPARVRLLSSLPSFQANLRTLDRLRSQLAGEPLPYEPCYEKRYPFLDRELLEFLFSVPRRQIVRPGQRRSLMRRSLAGILPNEVLQRRRKAFVARSPIAALSEEWLRLAELCHDMVIASLGIVDECSFAQFLENAKRGRTIHMLPLLRTLYLEIWLRNMASCGFVQGTGNQPARRSRALSSLVSAEKH